MKLIHPAGQKALACLRAMRAVTAGGDSLPPAARALMRAAQRVLMSLEVDLDTLPPIDAVTLKAAIVTPGPRRAAVSHRGAQRAAGGDVQPCLLHPLSRQRLCLPGERGGFPYTGAYHDMTHVLSGYGITPEGELLLGGFTTGFKRTNPFYVVLLTALLWGAGIHVTPLAQPHQTGTPAKPGLAEEFIIAIERGSRVDTDLSDNWDFWPSMPLPLEEARTRLGIAA